MIQTKLSRIGDMTRNCYLVHNHEKLLMVKIDSHVVRQK